MKTARRTFLIGALAACTLPARAADELAAIEGRTGGRLGVAVLDTKTGKRLMHRPHDRFPMCSTFKFLLAADLLKRIDAGTEDGDRVITYTKADLLPHSPETEKHLATGMSVSALCKAVVTQSDNTAANLLLGIVGGPKGWTRFARSLGDKESRLDRTELDLNRVPRGDVRDTTTPAAMLADMQHVLAEKFLTDKARKTLLDWMAASAVLVGAPRLRAGIPPAWTIGDKTGTGEQSTNDIAVINPPWQPPIFATVYLSYAIVPLAQQEAAIADVGRLIGRTFG